MLELTAENYYGSEANWQYMSASQYKSFRSCEAAAMAELRNEWNRPSGTALLVGSYVDAFFSDELEQFKLLHPEIFKFNGELKADFQKAHAIAERLARDDLARMLLSGQHQTIKTGKIGGVWYKGKYDSLLEPKQVSEICEKFPEIKKLVPFGGPLIVDLKSTKDFGSIWNDDYQEKQNFVNYWGYDIQGAIYQKLDGRFAPFVIVGVTKEPEPDIEALYVPDEELADCLADVEANSPRYAAIKRGEIEPEGCGRCNYCKSVKRLSTIKHYRWRI